MILDTIHGPADFITFYRNRATGWQPGGAEQTVPMYNFAWSRYTNAIGNVFGTAGYHTRYTTIAGDGTSNTNCWHSIYAFGISAGCYVTGNVINDSLVAPTAMRWGNYDTVNNAVRWVSSEVPSGLSLYSNPVPSSQTLPPSFYLSSKPAFFGNAPFPLVGPDVTGGDLPNLGGFAYSTPASTCFHSTPVDTSYASGSSVTGASWSGGIATITIGAAAKSVNPAQTVTVSGMNPSAYNCQHCTVVSTTASTVSYSLPNNPGSSGSGGTSYWPDVALYNADACYAGGPQAPTGLAAKVQ
jgi:hypothetical protein